MGVRVGVAFWAFKWAWQIGAFRVGVATFVGGLWPLKRAWQTFLDQSIGID